MPEDDWRPKLTVIEAPIADDYWRYTTPEGKRRISRVTVGQPVQFPQERCWYAPVMIEGYLTKVTPIFGQGPVDALMNAMMFIKRFNDEMHWVSSGAKPRDVVKRATQPRHRKKAVTKKVQRKHSHSSRLVNRGRP